MEEAEDGAGNLNIENVGYRQLPYNIPPIMVICGTEQVQSISAPTVRWNGAAFERRPLFQGGSHRLPVEAGSMTEDETITVDFGEYPPDEVFVTETPYYFEIAGGYWVAGNKSDILYGQLSESLFEIRPASLSPTKYRPANYYSLIVRWGKNIYEYGFFVTVLQVKDSKPADQFMLWEFSDYFTGVITDNQYCGIEFDSTDTPPKLTIYVVDRAAVEQAVAAYPGMLLEDIAYIDCSYGLKELNTIIELLKESELNRYVWNGFYIRQGKIICGVSDSYFEAALEFVKSNPYKGIIEIKRVMKVHNDE